MRGAFSWDPPITQTRYRPPRAPPTHSPRLGTATTRPMPTAGGRSASWEPQTTIAAVPTRHNAATAMLRPTYPRSTRTSAAISSPLAIPASVTILLDLPILRRIDLHMLDVRPLP